MKSNVRVLGGEGSRRTRITHPGGGFYVDQDFLVTGELWKVRENGATSGVGVLATYAYDDRGRRTSLTRGNGTATTYGFDAASRLSSLVEDLGGTTPDQTLGFTYNPAGQIATNTRSNDLYAWNGHYNASRTYASNGLNQYGSAGSVSFGYDGRGNLVTSGTTTYAYTSENQLKSGPGTTLAYDPAMRLYQTTAAATTRFGYDGVNLVGEYNGSNTLLRRYVQAAGADEPLVWYEGSGTTDRRFLHTDERGSVIATSNASGTVTATNAYDEYGIPKSTNTGRFQYTGQTWLPELGLYYYKARIYSPTLGRFLQTDPIGYGDGMNMYACVGGDPVNSRDPTGLEAESEEDIVITGKPGGGGSAGTGGGRSVRTPGTGMPQRGYDPSPPSDDSEERACEADPECIMVTAREPRDGVGPVFILLSGNQRSTGFADRTERRRGRAELVLDIVQVGKRYWICYLGQGSHQLTNTYDIGKNIIVTEVITRTRTGIKNTVRVEQTSC